MRNLTARRLRSVEKGEGASDRFITLAVCLPSRGERDAPERKEKRKGVGEGGRLSGGGVSATSPVHKKKLSREAFMELKLSRRTHARGSFPEGWIHA